MRKIISIFIVIALLVSANILPAQEVLSLEALIKEAQSNNPEILAARKRWEASQARVPQAGSLDNPSVAIAFEKIPRSTFQLNNTMADDRMLSIQQMFPFFGKLTLKKKMAVVEAQMAGAEYKDKELEIVNELKNTYYDLFMNYKEIELSRQSLVFLEAIAKITESRYSVGDMPQEEVFKLQLETAKLNTDIINLEQEKLAKQTSVNTLLSRDPEGPLDPPYLNEDISFSADIKELYKTALLNQPELIIFSYAIEKNKYARDLAKKSFFPDMMAALTQRGIASGMSGPWDMMLSFSLPLWFWTKQRYEVREAIANLDEAKSAYEAMKNKAFNETREIYAKIEIARNKVNLSRNNLIPVLESSIASSLSGFQSGRGDFMLLLDSQRMLIEAKMDYYKALVEYNMNVAELERTVGVEFKIPEKL